MAHLISGEFISALNKNGSKIPPLCNTSDVLPSASDKAELIAENFSGISLLVFLSRTNLRWPNIHEGPVKVIANIDSPKASGPDFISVVVLKNCEPELSYKPAELWNMSLK